MITASVKKKKLRSMQVLVIILQFESKNCFVLSRIIQKNNNCNKTKTTKKAKETSEKIA